MEKREKRHAKFMAIEEFLLVQRELVRNTRKRLVFWLCVIAHSQVIMEMHMLPHPFHMGVPHPGTHLLSVFKKLHTSLMHADFKNL